MISLILNLLTLCPAWMKYMIRDKAHLKFLRGLPCCMSSNNAPSDPAHISKNSGRGIGIKASDIRAVPLTHIEHLKQHQVGEITYWGDKLEDAILLGENLYRVSGNWEKAVRLILEFRRK